MNGREMKKTSLRPRLKGRIDEEEEDDYAQDGDYTDDKEEEEKEEIKEEATSPTPASGTNDAPLDSQTNTSSDQPHTSWSNPEQVYSTVTTAQTSNLNQYNSSPQVSERPNTSGGSISEQLCLTLSSLEQAGATSLPTILEHPYPLSSGAETPAFSSLPTSLEHTAPGSRTYSMAVGMHQYFL